MTTSVKKLRDDMYLISWSESVFMGTKTVNVKLDVDDTSVLVADSTTFKFSGNGTTKLDLELSKVLPTSKEKIYTKEMLPSIFANKDGNCQFMTPKKGTGGTWMWSASWTCTQRCGNCTGYDKCAYCAYSRPFFSVQVVIDFKDDMAYLKTGEKNVLEHLSKLLKEQHLADLTFKVKNETLKAHSIIVAAGSTVLSAMFQHDADVSHRPRVVEIKDTKPQVFKQLLQYLYTGKVHDIAQEGMAHDLIVAADNYGVESLKDECASVLIRNLKVENAARTLVTAHLQSSPKLHEATLSFMSKHGKAICSRSDWMDIIKSYPELCFQATQLMMMGS